ncbi:MAG: hypothetical protein JWR61_3649 [Ferruginibacter sp.]|uniref:hypothetical protein n=1 Tax=Ferruginibacter sp. TaxID=1940288 RepID=UPI002657AC85|nr:hypothetical protein [Ferruginibacter sp.]MDB5278694.1 hypothetical protein [Ferruginibacter sp.]
MKPIFLSPFIVIFLSCSAQKKVETVLYKAGFKTIHWVDTSRIYRPNTDATNYLHYRPLDLDVWYPATAAATDSVLLFRNILGLFDERANYYTASDAGDGLSRQLAQLYCTGFKCGDTAALLNYKTSSYKNATANDNKFPLVIYLAAYNGMSYENYSLFETLAQHGFVVVSISSIGRFPGDMTMKKEDLAEQVNDAIVSLKILRNDAHIDFTKVGIVGYSWGGLAGAVAAGKIANAACLVSLDGSEFHHYGAKAEDADFDGIKNSAALKDLHLAIPYLRLESSPPTGTDKMDSVYNFMEKVNGEKQLFKIDSARHEDFSCMSFVVRAAGKCTGNNYFNTISKLTVSFLETTLKNENNFSLISNQEINKTVRKK